MNKYNLLSVIRRRSFYKFRLNGDLIYANILNRNFRADKPNCKWVTDISYIITPEGVLCLSAIRDLFDNYVVAYKMSVRQGYALVSETIRAAMETEKPQRKVILHSDGGGQYRSFGYREDTKNSDIAPSMLKPASPGDNAMAENFFSIFKTECIYLEKPWTISEARLLAEDFIN
jgi:transposase InsO family protein